jgi:hypothetical protein|tara:strand:+ start:65 stop:346 length:282 start_codon:yes stop_codon:yes gene_type:complete
MPKHSQELIDQAHDLAFKGDLSNKEIAKKLNLTANQLHYILYTKQDSGYWIKEMKDLKDKHGFYKESVTDPVPPKKPTIAESFLDFFTLKRFR